MRQPPVGDDQVVGAISAAVLRVADQRRQMRAIVAVAPNPLHQAGNPQALAEHAGHAALEIQGRNEVAHILWIVEDVVSAGQPVSESLEIDAGHIGEVLLQVGRFGVEEADRDSGDKGGHAVQGRHDRMPDIVGHRIALELLEQLRSPAPQERCNRGLGQRRTDPLDRVQEIGEEGAVIHEGAEPFVDEAGHRVVAPQAKIRPANPLRGKQMIVKGPQVRTLLDRFQEPWHEARAAQCRVELLQGGAPHFRPRFRGSGPLASERFSSVRT